MKSAVKTSRSPATRPRSTAGNAAGKSIALALLGGLSAAEFMRRHWQKRPLLVRQAVAEGAAPTTRQQLFALAGHDDIESRLIQRPLNDDPAGTWRVAHGPFRRQDLPPVRSRDWTLLVQGANLHVAAAQALMERFRFIPDARLDDVMISWASEGGGVGPHFDSYDVFLLQVAGQRRWRIGRMPAARLMPDQPLKLIADFEYEQEWLLGPGDMLYLPPGWAHDGVAMTGDCMTCSVGFRAPQADELTREILLRLADAQDDAIQDAEEAESAERAESVGQPANSSASGSVKSGAAAPRRLYRDPSQAPTIAPARVPDALLRFARTGLAAALRSPGCIERALGEYLSEPKGQVCFDPGPGLLSGTGVRLSLKTAMLYDDQHVFINGESLLAAGKDAVVLRRLADVRSLSSTEVGRASRAVRDAIDEWLQCGWLQAI